MSTGWHCQCTSCIITVILIKGEVILNLFTSSQPIWVLPVFHRCYGNQKIIYPTICSSWSKAVHEYLVYRQFTCKILWQHLSTHFLEVQAFCDFGWGSGFITISNKAAHMLFCTFLEESNILRWSSSKQIFYYFWLFSWLLLHSWSLIDKPFTALCSRPHSWILRTVIMNYTSNYLV